jgi:glycosyltransferase involved in cell wall biosynthesis
MSTLAKKSILFVVHRYAPFPGGSEYYVQNMAEESLRRGHSVSVLAHTHQGNLNGVTVTSDYQVLGRRWDLIVVHGGDCVSQNIVHMNARLIRSPVLYMLIKPSTSDICYHGLYNHNYLGYSTTADLQFIRSLGPSFMQRARRVRHGVVPEQTYGRNVEAFEDYGEYFVSAGGWWPHKRMIELADAWEASSLKQKLILFGYDANSGPVGKNSNRVKWHTGWSRDTVMGAIAGAEGYIMNSSEEGFGLVLLESMINCTPWLARPIAGAFDLREYGTIYSDEADLIRKIESGDYLFAKDGYAFALANHTIVQTVNDLEDVLYESTGY